MSIRRQTLLSTMQPLDHGHRLRHHGKHHQSDVVSDVINSTTVHSHLGLFSSDSVCYTTNEVLIIIGLTCVLNLAFIAVVMTCVHFCSTTSNSVANLSKLESLLLVDSLGSDSDLELWDKGLQSPCRQHSIEDFQLRSRTISLQRDAGSSSMFSLHTLVPSCLTPSTSKHGLPSSFSMDNLLFV